ncbi:organic solute transporter subunit alpha-like [Haliotis rubra]|uniref:organic solute transporter subunit alpha-like n=1 Tax=Haliotis rubra TaxID=36100 RepID=UPI001EE62477|nr:organic solute transporter subunit alpha-like [Haliotis rubra]XP_046550061.1 organic solute transporter subunit alpha-like [Haliotis rubra]
MTSGAPNTTGAPNCPDVVPLSEVYFAGISTAELAVTAVCAVIALANVIMYLESTWFIIQHFLVRKTKVLSLWMIGLQPVFAVTALIAVCIPRSSLLSDLVAAIYLSICMRTFLQLMIHYHGGEEGLINHMSGETINLRSPPVACCCCCCPKIEVNKKNLFRIKMCVLQFALLRPILVLLSAVLWTDNKYVKGKMQPNQATLYLSVLSGVSTLTAMYGLILVFRASRKHLKEFYIGPKFICIQLVLVFSNLQGLVFNTLANNNLPPCTQLMSSAARGDVWNHLIVIVEMFLLALLARRFYRRTDGQQIIMDVQLTNSEDPDKVQKDENSSLNNGTNEQKYSSSGKELEQKINYM